VRSFKGVNALAKASHVVDVACKGDKLIKKGGDATTRPHLPKLLLPKFLSHFKGVR